MGVLGRGLIWHGMARQARLVPEVIGWARCDVERFGGIGEDEHGSVLCGWAGVARPCVVR
jgi:hypothetical protein